MAGVLEWTCLLELLLLLWLFLFYFFSSLFECYESCCYAFDFFQFFLLLLQLSPLFINYIISHNCISICRNVLWQGQLLWLHFSGCVNYFDNYIAAFSTHPFWIYSRSVPCKLDQDNIHSNLHQLVIYSLNISH